MLANALTKKGERWQIENYYRGQRSWKLIHDQRFMSAKSRRKLGIETFETAAWLGADEGLDSDDSDGLLLQ
eukprot:10878962-Alexandrium_andersonii.AAC.1